MEIIAYYAIYSRCDGLLGIVEPNSPRTRAYSPDTRAALASPLLLPTSRDLSSEMYGNAWKRERGCSFRRGTNTCLVTMKMYLLASVCQRRLSNTLVAS
jgi:hypothetical protein